MDYNTDRELLILPEYGRTVQNMVDYAMTLTDRSERQRCAETIVDLMQHMFPTDMDASDARRVYWDHLARLSHYELDIDYPVEIIREDEATKKPSPLPYPMKTIERRHYGYLLEELMRRTGDMEPSQERDRLVELTSLYRRPRPTGNGPGALQRFRAQRQPDAKGADAPPSQQTVKDHF